MTKARGRGMRVVDLLDEPGAWKRDEEIEAPRMKLQEVAAKLGVSKQRASTLERRAFAKLWEGLQGLTTSDLLGADAVMWTTPADEQKHAEQQQLSTRT